MISERSVGGRKTTRSSDRPSTSARPDKDRSAPVDDPPQEIPDQTPVQTYLLPEELAEFRTLLLHKRAELVGDIQNLTNEALGDPRSNNGGNLSNMPIHMADIGSDNWEQEFNLDLMANEQQMLKDLDAALKRIENRTYGMCEATGKPITKKRLRAKPWARYCIEYAREMEKNKGL